MTIRVYVEIPQLWEGNFTGGLQTTLSLAEQLALPGANEKLTWTGGDATMERVGVADWDAKVYGHVTVSEVFAPLLAEVIEGLKAVYLDHGCGESAASYHTALCKQRGGDLAVFDNDSG